MFSRTDAWAFAEIIGLYSHPYVVRFNGSRWLRVFSPLLPQDASAPAPDDIWTVGPLTGPGKPWAAAHWNGSTWRTVRFPDLRLPRGAEIGSAAIEAASARDAWVGIGLTNGVTSLPGIIVLHWNGRAWSKVTVPYRRCWSATSAGTATAASAMGVRRGPAVTLARITTLIDRLFHVRHTLRGTSYLLHPIGYTPQVQVHRAADRDETAIAAWRPDLGKSTRLARRCCRPLAMRVIAERRQEPVGDRDHPLVTALAHHHQPPASTIPNTIARSRCVRSAPTSRPASSSDKIHNRMRGTRTSGTGRDLLDPTC